VSKRFGRGKLNLTEDVNPMEGLINLADVMLVLAAGLLLALIINWNIDIGETASGSVPVTQGQEVSGMEGIGNENDGDKPIDYQEYEKMGTVYKDPSTGKLYMVTSDE
jgi:hypothetical protein